jgi:hypothetical protein
MEGQIPKSRGEQVSTLRLQSWSTNRRGTYYTVNLDGVPLGCDGLFADPALVITVGSEVAKVPHSLRDDGAMMFVEPRRACSVAAQALKDYAANQERLNKGVHFDREEAAKLRELAEYLMRGYVGPHAKTVEMIRQKVPR